MSDGCEFSHIRAVGCLFFLLFLCFFTIHGRVSAGLGSLLPERVECVCFCMNTPRLFVVLRACILES